MYQGAIVGLGNIARQSHLPGFTRGEGLADRIKVVATVDGAEGVSTVPGLPLYRRLDQLPAPDQIDFIDVCTPTASHLELTLWGLERGYHVLCEKPVALSREEAVQITRAAHDAGRVVMPCHQYRFNPAWLQIRKWLAAGVIGRWHLAEFFVYRTEADAGAARGGTPWRGRREASRGGILLDHGTHLIYQLLDVAGMPKSVHSWTGRLRHHSYDVEDTAQLLLDFGDRIGTFFLTWSATRRDTRIRFFGDEGSIEWSGGLLRREGQQGVEVLDFTAALSKENYYQWFAGLFAAFADAMDNDDRSGPLSDIARVAQVLDAAYLAREHSSTIAVA